MDRPRQDGILHAMDTQLEKVSTKASTDLYGRLEVIWHIIKWFQTVVLVQDYMTNNIISYWIMHTTLPTIRLFLLGNIIQVNNLAIDSRIEVKKT